MPAQSIIIGTSSLTALTTCFLSIVMRWLITGATSQSCGGAKGLYYGPTSCCNPAEVCVQQNYYVSQVWRFWRCRWTGRQECPLSHAWLRFSLQLLYATAHRLASFRRRPSPLSLAQCLPAAEASAVLKQQSADAAWNAQMATSKAANSPDKVTAAKTLNLHGEKQR